MPDDVIDMTITSPPYDDLRDYNGYHFPVEEIAAGLFAKTKDGGVVVWVVGDHERKEPPPGTIPYGVENVPNVLYFSLDAEALHGAYWHNNFGNPMSHGCVNLPLDVAAFVEERDDRRNRFCGGGHARSCSRTPASSCSSTYDTCR